MDKREYIRDDEEALRTAFAGLMRAMAFATPCVMSEDTPDGHRCSPQPSIKRAVTDPTSGDLSYEDHPIAVDVPIHYAGGKKVVATHPVGKSDEGLIIYADRSTDVVLQQGGTQQPLDDRQHHHGDGTYIPGIRSDPKKLAQVDPDAHHVRSVDKKHVASLHPDTGHHVKSVDPSTAPASDSFDPFTQATKFFEHLVHPTSGAQANATDGDTTHSHGVDHGQAWMRVLNGLHEVLAHPSLGALLQAAGGTHLVQAHPQNGGLMSALNGLHQVLAHPSTGAALMGNKGASSVIAAASVALKSATGISMDCPLGGFSMPKGAAAANVGTLSGDLAGTLTNPQVVSVLNVSTANLLPNAANDSAAASAGVGVGSLYRNGSQLMVRVA